MSKLKIFLSFLCFLSIQGYAKQIERTYIEHFAKTFVEENIASPADGQLNVQISPIDPRITIKACDAPLQAELPDRKNTRNINVKISCFNQNNQDNWQLFVPAKILITVPVVVAKNYIAKGSLLTRDNIKVINKDYLRIRGEFYRDLNKVLNTKTTKSLAQGKIVNKHNICLVCKGEKVTINAGTNNFLIRTDGVAISSGTLGQSIRVKNSRSGKIISGQIIATNQVKIPL